MDKDITPTANQPVVLDDAALDSVQGGAAIIAVKKARLGDGSVRPAGLVEEVLEEV